LQTHLPPRWKTAGGGRFFGKIGRFEKGYAFDTVAVDDSANSLPRTFAATEHIERGAYLGRSRVEAKFVNGRRCAVITS